MILEFRGALRWQRYEQLQAHNEQISTTEMQFKQLMSNCSDLPSQKLEGFHSKYGLGSLGFQLLKLLNCYLLRNNQLSQPGYN